MVAEFSGTLSFYVSLSINMSLIDLVDDTIEKGINVKEEVPGFHWQESGLGLCVVLLHLFTQSLGR